MNGAGARRKGISYQHDVAVWLEEHVGRVIKPMQEVDADDLIVLAYGLSVECKNQKTMCLAEWTDQSVRQAAARGLTPVLVHKRPRKADVGDHYVTMRAADFAALLAKLSGVSSMPVALRPAGGFELEPGVTQPPLPGVTS